MTHCSVDGTAERARKDDSMRFIEAPSLGGSLLPNDALRTQENLLNTSSEAINKLAMEPAIKRAYSTGSPEKGPVHSPAVSEKGDSPHILEIAAKEQQ